MTEQTKTIAQSMRVALEEISEFGCEHCGCATTAYEAIEEVDNMSHQLTGIDYSFMESYIDSVPIEELKYIALAQYEHRIELASNSVSRDEFLAVHADYLAEKRKSERLTEKLNLAMEVLYTLGNYYEDDFTKREEAIMCAAYEAYVEIEEWEK